MTGTRLDASAVKNTAQKWNVNTIDLQGDKDAIVNTIVSVLPLYLLLEEF